MGNACDLLNLPRAHPQPCWVRLLYTLILPSSLIAARSTPTMLRSLDAPQVQQDAPLSGSFGSAVYDSVSSAYIAYGYSGIPFSRMSPSASYGPPPPSDDNFTLVNPSVDILAYLELGGFRMCWYEHPAAFLILIAILGHITGVVHKVRLLRRRSSHLTAALIFVRLSTRRQAHDM